MKNSTDHVTIEEAWVRVQSVMTRWSPLRPSVLANSIWPSHKMKAQGAAFAASAMLKKLEAQGLVRWTSSDAGALDGYKQRGWVLTKTN